MNKHITASPLTWPEGWKREEYEISSRFGKWNKRVSIAAAVNFTLDQLRIMKVSESDVIISTDLRLRNDGLPYSVQRDPDDKGVAVWWYKDDIQQVIALDKYDRIADNIYAIGKTLEAMRGIERWGGGEILNRTFTGFVALPDLSTDWRSILGNAHNIDEARLLFKKKRIAAHPDKGGSEADYILIVEAFERAKKELS